MAFNVSDPAIGAESGRVAAAAFPTRTQVILSFDVEEHDHIEAANGLSMDDAQRAYHRNRLALPTEWLLDQLDANDIRATFFIVGQIVQHNAQLIRTIHRAGHEIASHSWSHRYILRETPESFRQDLRTSCDALAQVTGAAVVGYRAPTFSILRKTAWALDVLAEEGLLYDSSIYPVRHDRYGEPGAPRGPFLAQGLRNAILELPPATLRLPGMNLPVGGGGYFRLFPLFLLERAIRQATCHIVPPIVTLYFHPWEFDPDQRRLPLGHLSRFRTYVGTSRSRHRLVTLLSRHSFVRAIDVARQLDPLRSKLTPYALVDPKLSSPS
jgi:polysaccharide deacetylase family protein (PEP-CTERM system associated)